MFCPQHNENLQKDCLQSVKRLPSKKYHRRRKYHHKQGHKKHIKKDNPKIAIDMSKWAENFTVAATWQLKHQVAYWKARATALEYENSVLHDIIRNSHGCKRSGINTDYENVVSAGEERNKNGVLHNSRNYGCTNQKQDEIGSETEIEEFATENSVECDESEDDVVVSEEYIQYLAANAKYREDAKRERDLLKAKQEAIDKEVGTQEEVIESAEEKRERLKEMYGDKWQRISALEMSTMSNFINKCDRYKPVYWPNIPFNFNYS